MFIKGQEIQELLKIKPGQEIGKWLNQLLDWQYKYPQASKDDCINYLIESSHCRRLNEAID